VGTTGRSQNVQRSPLLLSPMKANCVRFSATVCDKQFTLSLFFLFFFTNDNDDDDYDDDNNESRPVKVVKMVRFKVPHRSFMRRVSRFLIKNRTCGFRIRNKDFKKRGLI
jgi:hypothetical protein